jgi:26S proteasome regulatory subunit N6
VIRSDPIVSQQISSLYDKLLEMNLFKVIEPYTRVQIEFIAEKLNLDA